MGCPRKRRSTLLPSDWCHRPTRFLSLPGGLRSAESPRIHRSRSSCCWNVVVNMYKPFWRIANNYMFSYYMHSTAIIEPLCALFLQFESVANSSSKDKPPSFVPIFRTVSTSSILIPKMSRQAHLAWNCLRLLGPKIFLWRSESLAKKRSINAWCS